MQISRRTTKNLHSNSFYRTRRFRDHPLIQPSPLLCSRSIASVGNCEQGTYPQFRILSSNKQMLLVLGTCQNEDPRSAVFVGLPHNFLRIFPPKGRMNFRLTVLAEISESKLCLVFGHSLVACVEVCSHT